MTNTTNITTTTDPRVLFGQGVLIAGGIIGGVRAEQMSEPTPCDDYDVRGLLGHLRFVLDRVAVIGEGGNPFAAEEPATPADDAWLAAWQEAAAKARAIWADDAVLERVVVLPWSQLPGGETLLGYLNEVVVHTWDLATATGQALEVPDEVVAAAFGAISSTLPGGNRTELFAELSKGLPADMGPFVAPFGEVVPTADDATPLDQLVAWNGRRP